MAVKFKVIKQAQPGIKGGGKYKYYARITEREKCNLDMITQDIADMSSFSRADAVGILQAFIDLIPEYLLDGKNVELGDLGTFSLSLEAEGMESELKVNRKSIKNVRVQFRPGVKFKKAVENPRFKKVSE